MTLKLGREGVVVLGDAQKAVDHSDEGDMTFNRRKIP
jgi:hypothetical protein